MAKFIINEGFGNEQIVEDAESFRLVDGYFWFEDSNGHDVYVISVSNVGDVKRVRESK